MKATLAEAEKYLQVISETPQRIARAINSMDERQLLFGADAKAWSVNDILAHLRSCADLWTYSIYAMLAENEPEFSDINERKWAKVTRYAELPFHESFQPFSMQRDNLVRVLRAQPFESWEKSAIIFECKHTVFMQVRRLAKHETDHIGQIEAIAQAVQ